MNHVKELVLERRNFKSYEEYNDILREKFKHLLFIGNVSVFEENREINVSFKIRVLINMDFFILAKEIFGDVIYKIFPKNSSEMIVEFYDIPRKVLQELDMEINANKFNL